MNGQEQQERATAVSRLRQELIERIEMVEAAALDAFSAEVDGRMKAVNQLRDEMVEADWAITVRYTEEIAISERRLREDDHEQAKALLAFVMLPWWKRCVWVVFGGQGLRKIEEWRH